MSDNENSEDVYTNIIKASILSYVKGEGDGVCFLIFLK